MIELDQSQIVTALIASSTACIVMLVGEFLRHKNSVSKTVQDKLHYDRAEVIKDLYKKLNALEKELNSLARRGKHSFRAIRSLMF